MKDRSLAFALVVALSTLLAAPSAAQTLPTRLVQSSDLVYLGSFTIPDMQDIETHWTGGRLSCEYAQATIGFNPSNNSLFIVCHGWSQSVAEISIPALGGRASMLQQPRQVANLGQINPSSPNEKQIGGLYVAGDRLIVSAYDMYDGAGSASGSHFVRSTNLSSGSASLVRVGNVGFTAGYMSAVPPEWQAALGGNLLTGACCMSVIGRTSFGPAISAVSSTTLLASPASMSAAELVGYPESHPTLGNLTPTTQYYGASTAVRGAVLVPGTASVLFFGQHGSGAYCYGGGTSSQNPGSGQCYDPVKADHGTHNYPYTARVWAYSAADMARVKAGALEPWDLRPYAMWSLPQLQDYRVGGAAFDAATGRLFVTEQYGDGTKPRVHVYRVDGASAAGPAADTTAPTVTVTGPSGTVSGTVSLVASANDNTGVTGVWFTVDGATVGAEDASAPYQVSWNSTTVANGSHTIRAVARDAAGNTASSAPVTVTVSNGTADGTAPTASVTAPATGATVSGQVTVSANASDNVGVTSVQFTLNDVNLGSPDTTAPYAITWDTRGAANGLYLLRAIARDAAGNTTTSAARSVTVSNVSSDTSRPSVSLSAPSGGATVANTVTVSASASDNVGVTAVQFTLNGVNLGSPDTSAPYAINWNTRGAANGRHVLRAVARDAAGNTRTSSARYVTVSNAVASTPPPSTPPPSTPPPSTPPPSTPPPSTPPPASVVTCVTPDPFAAMGGGTCYNGGWLPPGMIPPAGRPSATAPAAPSLPSAPSAPATPVACTTPRPGAGWNCHNGGWLPPGMTPPASAVAPPIFIAPILPSAPTGCSSPRPGLDWLCANGGWLPPNFPGVAR